MGKGGEEAPDELHRLQSDVIDEGPSVVIWLVGTNAVWKGQDLELTAQAVRQGVAMLDDRGIDVVLMDLQYVPAVLTPDKIKAAEDMCSLIAEAAETAKLPVNVFHRFDLMRQWHETEKISFDRRPHS